MPDIQKTVTFVVNYPNPELYGIYAIKLLQAAREGGVYTQVGSDYPIPALGGDDLVDFEMPYSFDVPLDGVPHDYFFKVSGVTGGGELSGLSSAMTVTLQESMPAPTATFYVN